MCTEPVYHGYLKYQWYRGSSLMFRQEYPVLYVAMEAMYTCQVVGEDFTKYCEFTVKGIGAIVLSLDVISFCMYRYMY